VLLVDKATDRALLDSILASVPESEAPSVLDVEDDQADEAIRTCIAAAKKPWQVTGRPPSVA
jgi:hypothetical protein